MRHQPPETPEVNKSCWRNQTWREGLGASGADGGREAGWEKKQDVMSLRSWSQSSLPPGCAGDRIGVQDLGAGQAAVRARAAAGSAPGRRLCPGVRTREPQVLTPLTLPAVCASLTGDTRDQTSSGASGDSGRPPWPDVASHPDPRQHGTPKLCRTDVPGETWVWDHAREGRRGECAYVSVGTACTHVGRRTLGVRGLRPHTSVRQQKR